MAALAQAEFKERLAASGIAPDEPLHGVLMTVFETAAETREIVGTGARGLSPAGEKELIARVAESSAEAAQHEVERLARRIGWKNASLMALAGLALLGGGYVWGGHRQVETGFLGQLTADNDVRSIERYCRAHIVRRSERIACDLGTVWLSDDYSR